MIAATVHGFGNPISDTRVSVLWLLLVLILGVLMASRIRYYSFKDIQWAKRMPSLAIVAIVLLIGSIVLFSQIVLMLIASAYVVQGIVLHLVRYVRHHIASRAA